MEFGIEKCLKSRKIYNARRGKLQAFRNMESGHNETNEDEREIKKQSASDGLETSRKQALL